MIKKDIADEFISSTEKALEDLKKYNIEPDYSIVDVMKKNLGKSNQE
jgi:hypothetical protein